MKNFEFLIFIDGTQQAPAARLLRNLITANSADAAEEGVDIAASAGAFTLCTEIPGSIQNYLTIEEAVKQAQAAYPGAVIELDVSEDYYTEEDEDAPPFDWAPHIGKAYYNYA